MMIIFECRLVGHIHYFDSKGCNEKRKLETAVKKWKRENTFCTWRDTIGNVVCNYTIHP